MRYIILMILLGGHLSLFAQTGDLYLQNYYSPISNTDYQNRAVIQNQRGVLFFANTKGVISYDGAAWEIISTLSTPLSLAEDTIFSGLVYVGCEETFGFLQMDSLGQTHYKSISEANRNFGEITEILLTNQYAFFYSDKVIYRVSLANQKVEKVWIARLNQPYQGIFKHQNDIYVNVQDKGLHRIVADELVTFSDSIDFSRQYINTFLPFDEQRTLVGTQDNQLFLFSPDGFSLYESEANEYLSENLLHSSTAISAQQFALATVSGGCIIVDKVSGSIVRTINYQTGLPDDEILSMHVDTYGGLWICTEFCISRADINLPIQNFAEYPGLEGKITTVIKNRGRLYTATTEGLFYLDQVKKLEELRTIIQEREIYAESKTRLERTVTITRFEDDPNREASKNILKKVFGSKDPEKQKDRAEKRQERKQKKLEKKNERRKKKGKDPIPLPKNGRASEVPNEEVSMASSIAREKLPPKYRYNTRYQYVSNTNQKGKNYALKSIPFLYRQVPNLKAKCEQLVSFEDKILVATNVGIYEVVGSEARMIFNEEGINFVYQSPQHPNRFYVGTANGLVFIKYEDNIWQVSEKLRDVVDIEIFSITGNDQVLWLGSENQVFKINLNERGKPTNAQRYNFVRSYSERVIVRLISGEPTFFLSSGIFSYNPQQDTLYRNPKLSKYYNPRSRILYRQANYTWTRPESRWENIHQLENADDLKSTFLSLFRNIDDIYVDQEQNIWIITDDALYRVHADAQRYQGEGFHLFVRGVRDLQGNLLALDDLKLDYKNSAFRLDLGSPFYLSESATEYRYKIEGLNENWSSWSGQSTITFPYLPTGKYTLRVKGKNIFGQESEEIQYTFEVKPPYWETWWFYLGAVFFVLLLIIGFLRIRTNALKAANKRLEHKVNQKTGEIELKKKQLEIAFTEIAKKNKDITDSIKYAQRIQEAILPYEESVYAALPDSFIFFKPRDVVSGDFYWFEEKNDILVIIAADCTGHGVPGAFMSMIGDSLLNQIINERHIVEPAQILSRLDDGIVKALKQNDANNQIWDGMDISICVIDKSTQQIAFAGAHNSMHMVTRGEVEVIKADRLGIGGFSRKAKVFTNHYLNIEEDTYFYLSSDGYFDQFGGELGRKFSRKRFRNLIKEIAHKPAKEQKQILEETLHEWKQYNRQIDDILIIGFRWGHNDTDDYPGNTPGQSEDSAWR